jgi:hypothetical protein
MPTAAALIMARIVSVAMSSTFRSCSALAGLRSPAMMAAASSRLKPPRPPY